MKRELSKSQLAERSLITKYRKTLWNPFVAAVKRYELIQSGDKIAVCISGGKDSMVMAKLLQQLQKHSEVPFALEFVVMDPGYNPQNRKKIENNAKVLDIPIKIFESDIFDVANSVTESPCYLCARMRRGHLYNYAKSLGCNKIALGHHFSDVIETTLIAMFYGSQIQGMLPKLHSTNFEGMTLIRPLYCVHENDIISWSKYNNLEFIQCACKFVERNAHSADGVGNSKRQEIKKLIAELKKTNPLIEKSIFNSIHAVCLDTMPGYKTDGTDHSFLERFNQHICD